MVEIWTYAVSATPTKVYYGVWGSGVLEYDQKTGRWDKYDDPDGENEMVLFKDQGLIHEIVTSVSYVDNILWAATYFGDSRYDGRYWHNFLVKDSGLPSNFTNQVKGVDGQTRLVQHGQRAGVLRRNELGRVSSIPCGRQARDDRTRCNRQGHIRRGHHGAGAQLHPRH